MVSARPQAPPWEFIMDEKEYALSSIRQHSKVIRERLEARDRMIRFASDNGATLREIADAAELTHPGIKKILDREPG